ncbi:cytochrome P450 [Nocardia sp. NPDC056100]|uniref:cytochrome P450 n=1 Tax=Nocardia sp. NPDC056100 TaxID=3345712 RepID=UPI0035D7BB3C
MTISNQPGPAPAPSTQVHTAGPILAGGGPPEPMYTEEFAKDPYAIYERWRAAYGPLVPIELAPGVPATLVIGYATAVRILNDPQHFPADPRIWQDSIPSGCPVKPMLEWRPNALRSSGYEHTRYRAANVSALDTVDLYGMHAVIERLSGPLIDAFASGTGQADLLGQYIYPLVYRVLAVILGFDDDTLERVSTGMAMMFDSGGEAEAGSNMMAAALAEHIARKRAEPGDDMTSEMIRSTDLSTEEIIHQLVTLHGAGSEPQVHLISNALLLMMTDERFAGDLIGGSLSTRDALDEVLFTSPPMANYCVSYPPQPMLIDGVWLPAHQPVLISMSACNADPTIRLDRMDRFGNRSHLAWGGGPHQCPARQLGYQIAMDAIDYLLDALPELRLAVAIDDLVWRPGPFHRALTALPVEFPPTPQMP